MKIHVATAHDSYEAWREGDHDDLMLSVALACWAGERFLRKPALVTVQFYRCPNYEGWHLTSTKEGRP